MGNERIGTEHLLLALLRDGDGLSWEVVRECGLSLDGTRKAVEEYLREPAAK